MDKKQLHGDGQDGGKEFTGEGAQTPENSRSDLQNKDVTGFQNRLEGLEEQVATLQDRVSALEGLGLPIDHDAPRRGPKQKIGDRELFSYRDALVKWFERIWPRIESRLCSASSTEEILALLETDFPQPPDDQKGQPLLKRTDVSLRPHEKRLLEHPEALLDFLMSGPSGANPTNATRFYGKPPKQVVIDALDLPWSDPVRWKAAARLPTRQIANAMAGVPDLEWRTSLDRCSVFPSELMIGIRTEEHLRDLHRLPYPPPGQERAITTLLDAYNYVRRSNLEGTSGAADLLWSKYTELRREQQRRDRKVRPDAPKPNEPF